MRISNKRYAELLICGGKLAEEEKKYGWHFCSDWDLLLISPDMKEWEFCNCRERELVKNEN